MLTHPCNYIPESSTCSRILDEPTARTHKMTVARTDLDPTSGEMTGAYFQQSKIRFPQAL